MICHVFKLVVDILVRDLDLILSNLEALVLAELNLGTRHDRGLEYDILALFERHRLDIRTRHDVFHLLVFQSLSECLRCDEIVKRLLKDRLLADMLLDHLARRLALAESRDVHLRCEALAGTLLSLVELCRYDLDGQDDLLVLYFFC